MLSALSASTFRSKRGREGPVRVNFLHLAILQPKGLKNLSEEVLQSKSVKALLSCEDNEGCTPLHYACRLGVHDAVKNMLGLSGELCLARKSKDKKSALHFAAQYGRINTCHRLLETITDSRLVNEGDERGLTPLHLASREGHTKVVELLLRKGALFHSDYKGWTCNTALHIAAREGHVSAVVLMLSRGAEIVLSRNDTSFVHEALQNGRQDVVNGVIDSDRCEEAMRLFNHTSKQRSPVLDMIEVLPESYQIQYNFQWLQAPISVMRTTKKLGEQAPRIQPLAALNIDLHTVLEDKLPYWFMKRVDKPFILVYPNRKCSKTFRQMLLFRDVDERTDLRVRQDLRPSRYRFDSTSITAGGKKPIDSGQVGGGLAGLKASGTHRRISHPPHVTGDKARRERRLAEVATPPPPPISTAQHSTHPPLYPAHSRDQEAERQVRAEAHDVRAPCPTVPMVTAAPAAACKASWARADDARALKCSGPSYSSASDVISIFCTMSFRMLCCFSIRLDISFSLGAGRLDGGPDAGVESGGETGSFHQGRARLQLSGPLSRFPAVWRVLLGEGNSRRWGADLWLWPANEHH
ncbi:hypothetical protein CRUP_013366 [Coryphaenoides rupestris]|nr:hypothetical protein CRUP_013366 [Coryphaenoides rupestris]